MRNQSTSRKIAGVLLIVGILTLAQSSFTRKEAGDISRRQVMFNNMPLTTSTMLLDARGVLAMVEGDPADVNAKKIPFQAFIKRGDVIINQASTRTSRTANEVEVGKLLLGAKKDDELIIKSIGENAEQTRRVLKLGGYRIYHWFPIGPVSAGGGC
ncbi:hypothetical protein [Telluribacter sp.]|jgi:hypothetical protein|uniref:hypothetical protein n=1 Tax=Telluribacter sp. TaxID=1978767 RepID=UPI002E13A2D2|nr:hypothetical protein [Telluribacter sp.]